MRLSVRFAKFILVSFKVPLVLLMQKKCHPGQFVVANDFNLKNGIFHFFILTYVIIANSIYI